MRKGFIEDLLLVVEIGELEDEIIKKVEKFEPEYFFAFICTLLEIYSDIKGLDVIEYAGYVRDAIIDMNRKDVE